MANTSPTKGFFVGARKQVSKKTRFEIFKRDCFLCQYCGNHPPMVVLEIDHIHPVSDGGSNDTGNLVTACFDCNRGKGSSRLEIVSMPLAEKAALIAERELQMRGYHEIMEKQRERVERDISSVVDAYERLNPGYTPTDTALLSIKKFVMALGVHAVIDNLGTAWAHQKAYDSFKYFCGICWRQMRGN